MRTTKREWASHLPCDRISIPTSLEPILDEARQGWMKREREKMGERTEKRIVGVTLVLERQATVTDMT